MTYNARYTYNDHGFFGAVEKVIGSKVIDTRIIRTCRETKKEALQDADNMINQLCGGENGRSANV